jgi:hypothetical protein
VVAECSLFVVRKMVGGHLLVVTDYLLCVVRC